MSTETLLLLHVPTGDVYVVISGRDTGVVQEACKLKRGKTGGHLLPLGWKSEPEAVALLTEHGGDFVDFHTGE